MRLSSGPDHRAGPDAWLAIYRELGERVFRLLHRMTGDQDEARDLTQDTFIRIYERAHQFQGRGSVRSWVFQVAANLARQEARTAWRHAELLERARPVLASPDADCAESIASRLTLEETLAELPEELRTAVLLHEVDGYTHAEIGEMTGVAEGTSKARVFRAKAALRDALAEKR